VPFGRRRCSDCRHPTNHLGIRDAIGA
jgi:hypothetical protein